jgi:hypothetical protein
MTCVLPASPAAAAGLTAAVGARTARVVGSPASKWVRVGAFASRTASAALICWAGMVGISGRRTPAVAGARGVAAGVEEALAASAAFCATSVR